LSRVVCGPPNAKQCRCRSRTTTASVNCLIYVETTTSDSHARHGGNQIHIIENVRFQTSSIKRTFREH
jgi:hypothetical protein